MSNRPLSLALLIILLLSAACRFLPGSQLPTAVPAVSPPPETGETPILMCTPPLCAANEVYHCDGDCPGGCNTTCATITPVASTPIASTPILMCTPPACQANEVYHCDGDCPGGCGTTCATVTPPASGEAGPVPADWASLENWLTNAWFNTAGASAARATLQTDGWQSDNNHLQTADLDGDQLEEWIVALHDPAIPPNVFGRAGNLWIINGSGVIYRFYPTVRDDSAESNMPTIVGLADMTGDGLPELVIDQHLCGAHTCYGNYQVLGNRNGTIQSLVNRPPLIEGGPTHIISVSYPDTRFADENQNGLLDFLVHGGSIGSAGAGTVRTYTEVWAWDGTAVTLATTLLDPTQHRHHILYEANSLMAANNLEQALLLYERAINDNTLITEPFMATEAETKSAIDQFAAFRLMLIDLLRNDPAQAAGRLTWLQNQYPGTAAAQGAAMLVNGWSDPVAQPTLCGQIETALAALPDPTGALSNMGYGNPSLNAEDYCP